MEIKNLNKREIFYQNIKTYSAYNQLDNLLSELRKKAIPEEVVLQINQGVDIVNRASDIAISRALKRVQTEILALVEKRLKMVAKNHHRNIWMSTGLATFGLPIGVIYGILIHNMAMLGLGLPIGLLIGMAVGSSMDKKALKEGRQLDIEIK